MDMLLASTAYTFLAPPCSAKNDNTPGGRGADIGYMGGRGADLGYFGARGQIWGTWGARGQIQGTWER